MLEFGTWGQPSKVWAKGVCGTVGRLRRSCRPPGGSSMTGSSRPFSSSSLEIREGGSGGTGEAGCRRRSEEREAAGKNAWRCLLVKVW